MRQLFSNFIFLIFVLNIFSCDEQGRHNRIFFINTESISKESLTNENFIVKDSSKYSRIFLDSLKHSGYATNYEIIDNILILDKTDTAYFPLELTFGDTVDFVGTNSRRHYFLRLRQINYTTISFGMMIYENSEVVESVLGDVNLPSLFFLDEESDDEDVNASRLAIEYVNSNKYCQFAIRIGKNENRELLAKIKLDCNDSTKNIEWRKSPTFRRIKNAS